MSVAVTPAQSQNQDTSEQLAQLGTPRFTLYSEFDVSFKRFDPLEQLARFEQKFPEVMNVFRQVGMHPAEAAIARNPYTGREVAESFTNIGEHCVATAYCAEKIAVALERVGVVTHGQVESIVRQALVHDLNKPYEIMRRSAAKSGVISEDVYSIAAYNQLIPVLEKAGIDPVVREYLRNSGGETGHNSLKDFIGIDNNGFHEYVVLKGQDISNVIVHLADDMTFTNNPQNGIRPITLFQTCWERMLSAQFAEKYPFLETEGLVRNNDGQIVAVRDINDLKKGEKLIGSYLELQVFVAKEICEHLKRLINPLSQQDAQVFIKSLVNSND